MSASSARSGRVAAAGYQPAGHPPAGHPPAGYQPAEAERAAVREHDPALADEVERRLARMAANARPGWLDR